MDKTEEIFLQNQSTSEVKVVGKHKSFHGRECLSEIKRIVVKIGSTTISDDYQINEAALDGLVHDLATIKQNGIEVILVTSGAIAAGLPHLGVNSHQQTLPVLQAAAAVGQIRLMAAYEERFRFYDLCPAQLLLTQDDFSDRKRYTRMNDALHALLQLGAIPIINENDSVAVDEIKVGDNDTLSAYVTNLAQADLLILLSDQQGLFTADPRHNPDVELIHTVDVISDEIWQSAGEAGTATGTGGMVTKLRAAEIVTSSGEMMVIAYGREPLVVTRLLKGELIGTLFLPNTRISGRKRWIAYSRPPRGYIVVDNGARDALIQGGKSLLPAGIQRVEGHFNFSDTVSCFTENGVEFARGLINYNSTETTKLAGKQTQDIEKILGYHDYDEIIHRDNLVLLN